MKLALALVIFTVSVVAANQGDSVNWSEVKPLDVNPKATPLAGSINGRITNGNIAEPNQFPYQVGLRLYAEGGSYWCGGSLISNRWVLTAAHCTDSLATGVDVYLGAWDRSNSQEAGQQIVYVTKDNVIIHEQWDPLVLSNDISLIKLPVEIEFNERIQPVKLPKKTNSYASYAGQLAIASGWGRISDEAISVTDKLRWIEVPVMANSGCSPWYLGSVKSTHICIKTTGGTSTCNGDSGGPLVLSGEEPILIGATSFGIALGCEKGWPGVFTRITSYVDWIAEKSGVVNN